MSVMVATAYMGEAKRFDWLMAMDDGKIISTQAMTGRRPLPAACRAKEAVSSLRRVTTRSASTTNSAGGHRSWSLLEVNGFAEARVEGSQLRRHKMSKTLTTADDIGVVAINGPNVFLHPTRPTSQQEPLK